MKICFLVFYFMSSVGNILWLTEGMKFSQKKYVVVLQTGLDKVPFAKINVKPSTLSVSYSISGAGSLVDIDNSGKLKLMKRLSKTIAATFNNTDIKIAATKQGTYEKTSTIVNIIILPVHFGDQYTPLVAMEKDAIVKGNRPQYQHITPRSLLRFLRRPSPTAQKIALAQLKLETKISQIKQKIIKRIAHQFESNAVILPYLPMKALFSERKMEEMDEESHCIEPTVVTKCGLRTRYRTFNGACNNIFFPNTGASERGFIRTLPALYFDVDGLNDPIGYPNQPNAPDVPSPHAVSRQFIKDEVAASSLSSTLTHAVMQFGQFIDHDLDLAVEVELEGRNICLDVPCNGSSSDFVCPCYPILPDGDSRCIPVTRSAAVCQKHGYPKPREQINVNTAFIDASQVYGSTKRVADELRQTQPEDVGLLKSSPGFDGELLPLDESLRAEELLCINLGGCFLAGDSRSNEQQSLAAFHSLFLREHNRIARILKGINIHWNGEKVYQETRSIMGAVMQKITYFDFLPTILGPDPLPQYKFYRPYINPGVSNAFATSAFRFGHSLIRQAFDVLDTGFNPTGKPIDLRFMFFNNTFIQRNGINSILLGLIGNFSEKVDRTLSSGITRHLFERENSPGSNLAALNIQRSRDHGIPGYNQFRIKCGLGNAKTLADTKNEIKDPKNIEILKQLYDDNPNLIELWVAGLAETPVDGASVGPTFKCIIKEQFLRTRAGDSFYFERKGVWSPDKLAEIKRASLSRMYCDNLNVVSIQPDAFKAPTDKKPRVSCARIPGINLCKWKDSPYFTRPCLHGKPVSISGKCKCLCTSPWVGNRCESKQSTNVPWHANILSSNKEILCSGALIRLGNIQHVVTTASCAKGISTNGYVTLGNHSKMELIAIKSIKIVRNDFAFIALKKKIKLSKNVYPIEVASATPQKPAFVTVWETAPNLRDLQTTISVLNAACIKAFSPRLKIWKEFCTLPADLPSTTKNGSPLVQFNESIPYLVGLLTDVAETSLLAARFGKYLKTDRLLRRKWIFPRF